MDILNFKAGDAELKGLFLLILAIAGNFVAETLNCRTQKLLSENMYAKHLISLFILFFSITLFVGDEPTNLLLKSVTIYLFFLLFTKMNLFFTIFVFILLAVYYMINLYIEFYSSLSEKEPLNYLEKINKLTEIKGFILNCVIISILVGFMLYFKKQYGDHSKKWSTSKFIFGVRNCNSMK